ncbi:MAG: TQO small subunit DoxD [Pseudolabrys sp.]
MTIESIAKFGVAPGRMQGDDRAVSASAWWLMGAAALASRLVLGWIYWGGASRRFIYAVKKINPESPGYLANKLVHAAPGIPFGLDGVVHWFLGQPLLLQVAVIGFSLVELVVGVGLIIGFATRLWSLIGLGLAAFLMIIFGWMGTTCLDEWTMAASGFAMAAVTLVAGSGPYSVDQLLIRSGAVERRPWLAWLTSGSLPISEGATIKLATVLGVLSIAFTVFFYGYNFHALYSPLHKRVDNLHPHAQLTNAGVAADGRLVVHTYINAGPDTQGLYIVRATLAPKAATGAKPVFDYDAAALKNKETLKIANRFAPWSTCKTLAYAVRCQLGSQATWSFAMPAGAASSGSP